jgi:hypothetical protein
MVRPSEWEVSGQEAVWLLDLKQMTVRADEALELLFFHGLSAVIEVMADVWDETDGEGILGLRHVFDSAVALLGAPARKAAVHSLAGEIKSVCAARLDQIGSRRGWQYRPEVMNLDI